MPDLDTGKYAAFVWPAYGLTALVFLVLVVSALGYSRRWRKRAEAMGDK